jgi:phosphoribosylformylglycinamidine (FGAM) synthase-like amidotransferase family enzyme
VVPLKNGEGGYVADDATLDRLEGEVEVVVRYLTANPTARCATSRGSPTSAATWSA